MKLLVQRSLESNVKINNEVVGKISKGLVIFVGFTINDNKIIVDKMIDKLLNLRIFSDKNGLMNLSLLDTNGEILSISQFTLYANTSKGRRPSFTEASNPEYAIELYNYFNEALRNKSIIVETGIFGANMKINIINDGPVTIMLDSAEFHNK